MSNTCHNIYKKGFTLLEIIVVVSITIMISFIVYSPLSSLNNRQILDKEVAQVESYIQKSRMNSLNSKNGDEYGITFTTSTVRVVAIIASSTTVLYTLNNRVQLASSTLGTSTIIFSRISGLPSATGTLMYVYDTGSSAIGTSTITINGLGITQ
jgi:prepilin-type N-terminal cleavage/methylation domain-containing protein